uniref:Unannotated protein n=1 Tax=freshwater metagenome TaxID=449393 RepID=A0A6J7NZW3_9ZZZZ
MSIARRSVRNCWDSAADASPILRRNWRTSVRPSVSPSTSSVPVDGCSYSDAMRTSVVLPEPLAPSTSQRSSGRTVQSSGARISRPSRTNDTFRSRSTSGTATFTLTMAPAWR